MPNFHTPVIIDRAVPVYRALLLEFERRRQELNFPMWKLDDIAGTQDGFFAKMLHADRKSGRQAQWKTLDLIVTALWPQGFDLEIKHKPGSILTAEDMRMRRVRSLSVSRRKLMSELGKRGAAARKAKLGKRECKQIARRASKIAAIKRSERAAARAQTQSTEAT